METNAQSQVKVIESSTELVLFTCSLDQAEQAYAYAAEMEKMDMDVKVVHPGAVETLAESLGINEKEKSNLEASIGYEIDQH
jgi:hypothetical protein